MTRTVPGRELQCMTYCTISQQSCRGSQESGHCASTLHCDTAALAAFMDPADAGNSLETKPTLVASFSKDKPSKIQISNVKEALGAQEGLPGCEESERPCRRAMLQSRFSLGAGGPDVGQRQAARWVQTRAVGQMRGRLLPAFPRAGPRLRGPVPPCGTPAGPRCV